MNEPSKEVREKYMELQMLQHQLQQVHQQVVALDGQANEMDLVQNALDEFGSSKPNSDAFVTLTPGLFAKAKIVKTDSVLLNVGAGAVVEKSISEAKEIVGAQGVELRKLQEELSGQLKTLASRAEVLQEELRALVK